ncbi:hypothetical protein [Desertivirga xinjiangensis]|uniref:hypothetical protein n=1 Tax=Desertivirga xinjiangensis TaxID=539206 RepID=UPI00210EEDA2|nr:hypothetical protein [Pedobacter xinjiangensis]
MNHTNTNNLNFSRKPFERIERFLILSLLMICGKASIATVTINGYIANPSRPLVISYWKDYAYVSDTMKVNKDHFFEKTYKLDGPMHIWINSLSYSFIMPGDTLTLNVKGDKINLNGTAAPYINFRKDLKQELQQLNTNSDYNDRIKYSLEKSEIFFSYFKHKQSGLIKKINEIDLILTIKFSSLLFSYNNNVKKMDSISNFIRVKQKDSTYQDDSKLLSFLGRLDFNDDLMSSHEALNTVNNFIRILRFHESEKNKGINGTDFYLIEHDIIKFIFNDSSFRRSLLSYNLYKRIQSSEDLNSLLRTCKFISDFKEEDNALEPVALINIYQQKLSAFAGE